MTGSTELGKVETCRDEGWKFTYQGVIAYRPKPMVSKALDKGRPLLMWGLESQIPNKPWKEKSINEKGGLWQVQQHLSETFGDLSGAQLEW